jgi:hypothetical protein
MDLIMKKTIIALALLAMVSSCIDTGERNCGTITDKNVSFTQRGDVIYSVIVETDKKVFQTYIVRESLWRSVNEGDKDFCYTNPAPGIDGGYRQ